MQFNSGPLIYNETIKMDKIQRKASKMIPEIRNHSYSQRLKDLNLINLEQRRLLGQLIKVIKYLRRFNNATARGLSDYNFNDRTRNNGEKLILKRFNTSIAQHFCPIKITTSWNALPSDIVSSRTVNTFKNRLDHHWELNQPSVRTIF